MCQILLHIYENFKYYHRDIKPSNFIWNSSLHIYTLANFSTDPIIQRDFEMLTGNEEYSGTPLYMSPEMLYIFLKHYITKYDEEHN